MLEIKINGVTVNKSTTGRGADLVFVIDTTGSMSNKIKCLLIICAEFAEGFSALSLNHRISIMAFGELKVPGDKILSTNFTSNIETTKKSLINIFRCSGGGNESESSLETLKRAITMPFRPNVVKVLILITDEPAHQDRSLASDITARLSKSEFIVFVISPQYPYFKEMAKRNAGKWYQIAPNTDFTDLLEMFGQIAENVSQIVSDVYELGDGKVSKYLELKPPDE